MSDKHLNLDKFYTNKDIVGVCYDAIKTHLDIDKNELIIEPSAGNGAFINIIKKLSNNRRFYDIKPETNYHLVYQTVIAPNSFTHFGVPKNIKTVFQIWIKKNRARRVAVKITPASWYSFDKKDNSDISIRRVGSKIGFVKLCEESDNTNTHWFIKINTADNDISKLLGKLNSLRFNKENNVGPLSISKQDIIKKYNSLKLA